MTIQIFPLKEISTSFSKLRVGEEFSPASILFIVIISLRIPPSLLYLLNLWLYIDLINALHPLESHYLFVNTFTHSFIFRQLVGFACTSACFQCLSIHCLMQSIRMFPSSDNLDSWIVSLVVNSKIKAKFIWLLYQGVSFLIILTWGDHLSV